MVLSISIMVDEGDIFLSCSLRSWLLFIMKMCRPDIFNVSIACCIIGLPLTGIRGFVCLYPAVLNLAPSPAIGISMFIIYPYLKYIVLDTLPTLQEYS